MTGYLNDDIDVAALREQADECETNSDTKLNLIILIARWRVLVRHGEPGDRHGDIGGSQFKVCPFCDIDLGAMVREDYRRVQHHEYCPWLALDDAVCLAARELSRK